MSSLVQHINRKRPRAFRGNHSETSSPRNSSTPMFRSSTAATTNAAMGLPSSTSSASNPFVKSGFNSSDPICLDSEDELEDLYSASHSKLGHGNFQASASDASRNVAGRNAGVGAGANDPKAGGHYDSDDSIIIVEERKLSHPPGGNSMEDFEINPFSNQHAINEFSNQTNYSSTNGSLNAAEDAFMNPSSYHSDSSFNPAFYPMQEAVQDHHRGPHSFENNGRGYYDLLQNKLANLETGNINLNNNNNNNNNNNGYPGIKNNYSFADAFYDDGAPKNVSEPASYEDAIDAAVPKKQKKAIVSGETLPRISYTTIGYEPINEFHQKLDDIRVPVVACLNHKKDCDEDNGHYKATVGKTYSNDRFLINRALGQGTFGKVVEAYDRRTQKSVAIKIIKAVPKYREAAKIELRVLSTLKQFDAQNKNYCIHLREVFDYKNHISLVTDLLAVSVFDFFDTNGFKSFPGSHIQSFAKQLLKSVVYLHDLNIIHTDLKPENILLFSDQHTKKYYFEHAASGKNKKPRSSSKKLGRKNSASPDTLSQLNSNDDGTNFRKVLQDTKINLIDFGSAVFNNEYHPELVSTRHYRAPEIAFGIGWGYECDLWSVGCILVELLIGEALFNTHDNREHMLMMEKITNQRLDLNLIKSCCVSNQKDLKTIRELRKPYESYGNHYGSPYMRDYEDSNYDNGYGSTPIRFSSHKINKDVYSFLEERGDSYLKLNDKVGDLYNLAKDRSGSPTDDSSSSLTGRLKKSRSRISKKVSNGIDYTPTGIRRIKQKFPKDTSSKTRKVIADILPIEEMVSRKIGVDVDLTLSLDEAYFKYCLKFSDSLTDKNLAQIVADALLNGALTSDETVTAHSSSYSDSANRVKNLNSVSGGCFNSSWIERMKNNNKTQFFRSLKREIEATNKDTNSNIQASLNNLIAESIHKRSTGESSGTLSSSSLIGSLETMQKRYERYPDAIAVGTETHINGQTLNIKKLCGPVDKDTFRFWYSFIDLLKKLLNFNPYKRPTAFEALNHEWFSCGIYDDGTVVQD